MNVQDEVPFVATSTSHAALNMVSCRLLHVAGQQGLVGGDLDAFTGRRILGQTHGGANTVVPRRKHTQRLRHFTIRMGRPNLPI